MKKKWRLVLIALLLALTGQLTAPAHASDVEDPLSVVVDQPSAWDAKDMALDVAGGNTRCAEGMYVTWGDCKYAQADYLSKCTLSTGGDTCFERTITKLRVRGGTADDRSPKRTGACPYTPPGSHSSFKSWQTTELSIWEIQNGTGVLRYQHVGIIRDNCDVQAGPFTVNPNVALRYPAYIHIVFQHNCRSGEPCGTQESWTDFNVNVD